MKNLKLRRLLLLSRAEGKARQESFDDETTVVFGGNDTGKSHLIKSIYSAFGADPQGCESEVEQSGGLNDARIHGRRSGLFDCARR